jgi:hypothetical protein
MLTLASPLLASCGSGNGGGGGSRNVPGPPPFTSIPLVRVSPTSTLAAGCNGAQTGTLYLDAEVEPSVALNPTSPANLIGAWQQDRWSNGGAQGLMLGASFDGGQSWTVSSAPFSRCTGGNAGNGGDFERATDPWVTFSPNGTAYALSLSFSGGTLQPGSSSAMLVARSIDGGLTWSAPTTLIRDGDQFFNDKGTITADNTDPRFVYAVWDRLNMSSDGPIWMARTVDGGATWEPARDIYEAGLGNQTIGNQIVVLPGSALVNIFAEIDVIARVGIFMSIRAIRSSDHGDTWSAPVTIAELLALGATDPDTGAPVRDGSDVPAVAVDSSGMIYVAWQDARFSDGQRDAIAISRSTDGGITWSTPVRVNADAATTAFSPTVRVRGDGVIGVTYYDFRNNTADRATLPTDYWIALSTDALTFRESHLSGPFDLDSAPDAGGLFLGDYQALASNGSDFLPFFVQTNAGGVGNRTDVFVGFARMLPTAQAERALSGESVAVVAPPVQMTTEWRQRVHDRIVRRLERRVPDWAERHR